MTLRRILAENTHVVTTTRRFDKLSTTILRGQELWPGGVTVSNGPDLRGCPEPEKQAGVTAQHRALWEKCRESGVPMCIIEDDAWCLRHHHPVLDEDGITDGDPLLFLGATYPVFSTIGDGVAVLSSSLGTHAYVITPASAAILCSIPEKPSVDHVTDAAIREGLVTGFLLLPEMFCQLDAPGDMAKRSGFLQRHRGHLGHYGGPVVPADELLGDAPLAQSQMRMVMAVPQPSIRDGDRDAGDWGIGDDDAEVISVLVELLQARRPALPLSVLEFGPGRSTAIFLKHQCVIRSFESSAAWAEKVPFANEPGGLLRVTVTPLHPCQVCVSELCAITGFGYDIAFVDAPSASAGTGPRDRRVTLECALQCAGTVILHDAHKEPEQHLLFEMAQSAGRCIRMIDTKLGLAVFFRKGSFSL